MSTKITSDMKINEKSLTFCIYNENITSDMKINENILFSKLFRSIHFMFFLLFFIFNTTISIPGKIFF